MKIVFVETKFNVNEEKNVVTCVIKAYLNPVSRQDILFFDEKAYEVFVVHGCAKCHPDDKFSLEIGKRIAESRAKKAVYQEGKIRANNLQKYIDIMAEDLETMKNNLDQFISKENEHIKIVEQEVNK